MASPAFALVQDGRCSFCCSLAAADRRLVGVDGRAARACSGCLALFIDLLEDDEECARGRRRRPAGPEPDAEARRMWTAKPRLLAPGSRPEARDLLDQARG